MHNIRKNLEEINQLVLQGQALTAFEKYYHDDVIMRENESTATIGKAANREREKEFFSKAEFESAEVKEIGIGEDVSFVKWHFNYTHSEWGIRNYTQVSVQQWRDGKNYIGAILLW